MHLKATIHDVVHDIKSSLCEISMDIQAINYSIQTFAPNLKDQIVRGRVLTTGRILTFIIIMH